MYVIRIFCVYQFNQLYFLFETFKVKVNFRYKFLKNWFFLLKVPQNQTWIFSERFVEIIKFKQNLQHSLSVVWLKNTSFWFRISQMLWRVNTPILLKINNYFDVIILYHNILYAGGAKVNAVVRYGRQSSQIRFLIKGSELRPSIRMGYGTEAPHTCYWTSYDGFLSA